MPPPHAVEQPGDLPVPVEHGDVEAAAVVEARRRTGGCPGVSSSIRRALTGAKPSLRSAATTALPGGRVFGLPTPYRVAKPTAMPTSTLTITPSTVAASPVNSANTSSATAVHMSVRQVGRREMRTAVA